CRSCASFHGAGGPLVLCRQDPPWLGCSQAHAREPIRTAVSQLPDWSDSPNVGKGGLLVVHSLESLFHPASVAILGASATSGSVGNIVMRNLLQGPFGGVVYPVNPKRRAVHGVYCYPSLADLPETPDLAIIATPAATVPELTRQCVNRGVKAAIILSAGFSE